MPLEHLGFVDLPAHTGAGGFDHAAVHGPTGLVYAAHTVDPPQIVVVGAGDPIAIRRVVPIPHAGPYGLDARRGRGVRHVAAAAP